jgi:glycosyltransferase involved in cell wall biosynthesis
LLAPARHAVSGVSTHLNSLLASPLRRRYRLLHFQVGSEGRREGAIARLLRLASSPFVLAAQIVRRNAVLVHINTSLNFRAYWRDCVYVLAARLSGARVLCQVHGGMLSQFVAGGPIKRWLVRATLAMPDALVVLSTAQREACRSLVPQQLVLAIPNGIAAPNTVPGTHRSGPLRLLYIGRLAKEKGLYEVMNALALSQARGVALHLTIAGSGEEEAGLRSLAATLGVAEAVTFAGAVFGERKRRLLESADAFVLPSYAEGMPYALLEAMSAGLPPIVTAVGAIPDVITPGVHGLFVRPRDPDAIADAIARLAANQPLAASMSAACRVRIAERYTIDRVASEFAALYARLCSGRRFRVVREA